MSGAFHFRIIPPAVKPETSGPWRALAGGFYSDDRTIEWAIHDMQGEWAEVHAYMVKVFEEWTRDDCKVCASHAAEQLPALRDLTPDTAWEGDVEGDEYMITLTTGSPAYYEDPK